MYLIAVAVSFLVAATWYWQLKKYRVETNLPFLKRTGPFPIGNLFWFVGLKSAKDLYSVITRIYSSCDRILGFWLGPKLLVMVKDPIIIEGLLTNAKCSHKDEYMNKYFNQITDGVFSRNGKRFTALRRPLDKLLNPKPLDRRDSVMEKSTTLFCQNLEEKCGNGAVEDLPEQTFNCLMNIVAEAYLGVTVKELPPKVALLQTSFSSIVDSVFKRILKFPNQFDWYFNRTEDASRVKYLMDSTREVMEYVVASREKEYERTGINTEHPDFRPSYVPDIASQAGKAEGLPREKLPLSFMDFVLAATDTSTITISSMILFLAMHQEYQEKTYQEQLQIMGDSLQPPNMEQISKMVYLTMVHNETLRHVSVPGIFRYVTSDLSIEGFNLPKGTSAYFGFHFLSKHPDYWEKPNDFFPDHFLPETVAKRPRGAFLPFSLGARSCPGKQIALFENRYIMSMLVRRFKFTTELKFHEMEYEYKIMIESTKGYPVKFFKRQ